MLFFFYKIFENIVLIVQILKEIIFDATVSYDKCIAFEHVRFFPLHGNVCLQIKQNCFKFPYFFTCLEKMADLCTGSLQNTCYIYLYL